MKCSSSSQLILALNLVKPNPGLSEATDSERTPFDYNGARVWTAGISFDFTDGCPIIVFTTSTCLFHRAGRTNVAGSLHMNISFGPHPHGVDSPPFGPVFYLEFHIQTTDKSQSITLVYRNKVVSL